MKNKKKTTIKDIANVLGLTPSAVSKALNDHPRISDKTKIAVRQIAENLNYQPNHLASALRKGKSNLVGVIIPRNNSNFFSSVVENIEDVLNKEGYNTSFYHGGMKGTMGFYSFSKKAGFTDYFGMQEYNNADDFDGTWGVYDGPFMQYFANGLNGKKEPFFSTFFSLSSHPPYTLPQNYSKELYKKSKLKEIGMRETISYTDYSMRDFFLKSFVFL